MKRLAFVLGAALPLAAALSPAPAQKMVLPAGAPQEVAALLDGVIQRRFLKTDMDKFGAERIVMIPAHDHTYRLSATNPDESVALARVKAAKYPFFVGFLRLPHPKGHDPAKRHSTVPQDRPALLRLIGPHYYKGFHRGLPRIRVSKNAAANRPLEQEKRDKEWRDETWGELEQVAKSSAASAGQGKPANVQAKDWFIAVRPVVANDAACLGCHRGAKKGDTLGAMAYAVARKPSDDPFRLVKVQTTFRVPPGGAAFLR